MGNNIPNIINDKIIVRNYKCFDNIGGGFDRMMPINIIIGKNNSGKSSLIELVKMIINNDQEFDKVKKDNPLLVIDITHPLTENEIAYGFPDNTSGGHIYNHSTHYEYGKKFIGKNYSYQLDLGMAKIFKELDAYREYQIETNLKSITGAIVLPFAGKIFCHITAERDINQEIHNYKIKLLPNGLGATNLIQLLLNSAIYDSKLVESELLNEINKIVNPDMYFSRILVQLNSDDKWEIFFEDNKFYRIALSKMGSGIKTILLVLLNLIVRPIIEGKDKKDYVFAFEELENNLHPSLQRRLYNYIRKYSEEYSVYFFLTTHSNVIIDSFGMYDQSQIIHIMQGHGRTITSTITSYQDSKHILNDLGLKASDILQSNGIIWVEGPSDRNYINKWISLLAPDLQEGLHYSIMFYGGRLLSNLTFDFERLNNVLIPLIKINTNAFVVIDRDGISSAKKINSTKKRIAEEIGKSNCWITKGREIENYIADYVISKWLTEKSGSNIIFKGDWDIKLEKSITDLNLKIKLKYDSSKTLYSSEISRFIDLESISVLDLKEKLELLIINIRNWNA